MNTPDLLQFFETCDRKGFYAKTHERKRLSGNELLQGALRESLTIDPSSVDDLGEHAGSAVMGLADDRGLDTSPHMQHTSVLHHAALADIITAAIRNKHKEPWTPLEDKFLTSAARWRSGAYAEPSGELRRVVLAHGWNDERHYKECHSWQTLGEVCVYNQPMTMAVIVLGENRDGRRHGVWAKGLLHPSGNGQLRFARKQYKQQGFKETWQPIWREEHAEISRRKWLQAMLDDDVLRHVCFTVRVEIPPAQIRDRILKLAIDKLCMLGRHKALPSPSLSVCDSPPCPYREDETCARDRVPSGEKFLQIS